MCPPESADTTIVVDLKRIKVAVGVDPPNGVAIVPVVGGLVTHCTIPTLVQLDQYLRKLMQDFTVVVCGFEIEVLKKSGWGEGSKTSKSAAPNLRAIGIIEACCGAFLVPMIGVSAQGVKHSATGNRSATKRQVCAAMEKLYGIKKLKVAHEGDALAIATEALRRFDRSGGEIPI